MKCTTEDGFELYYEVQGNASAAQTIVFLNGLTQTTEAWFLVCPFFKEKYRIILLDFIFQGKSDKKGEWRDFDQHARDVNSVLGSVGIQKVILLGISYGSLVAQHFAVLFPHKLNRLILISTFAHKTPYYDAVELAWWRALEKGGYNLMLDIMLPTVLSEGYFSKPLIPIQLMKDARKEMNQNTEAIFNLMKATRDRKDFRGDLKKINTATLVIQGEKDFLLPVHLAEEVHKHINGSTLIVIKHAGHTLNLEHVPEVCTEIQKFLKQVE